MISTSTALCNTERKLHFIYVIQIYNIAGQLKKEIDVDGNYVFNISELKNGLYIVNVISNTINISKKIAILNISYAKISSLSPLAGHQMLIEFICEGNAIDDISIVKNFYALRKLNIAKPKTYRNLKIKPLVIKI